MCHERRPRAFRIGERRAGACHLEILPPEGLPFASDPLDVRAGLDGTVEITLPMIEDFEQTVTVTAPASQAPEEVNSGFLAEPRDILKSAAALQDGSRYVQGLPGVVIGTNDLRDVIDPRRRGRKCQAFVHDKKLTLANFTRYPGQREEGFHMGSSRLRQFRTTRERTVRMLQQVSEADFDRRPGSSRWSAGELADHLIKSNRLYVGEINKLVELKRAGKQPRIAVRVSEMDFAVPFVPRMLLPFFDLPVAMFNYFVPNGVREFILSRPLVPVQAPPALKPDAQRGRAVLLTELDEELRRTEHLFADNAKIDFRTLKYYHPIFGFNDVEDILGLLSSHEERHQKQLQALLEANRTTTDSVAGRSRAKATGPRTSETPVTSR